MKRSYLGAVCEGAGTFGIVFRDFPGCVSAGDTLDEVLAMGAEALQGHVEAMVDAGELIASPSEYALADVVAWLGDGTADGEQWIGLFPITVEIATTPAAISVPVEADIVHEISRMVERNLSQLNPRQFIEQAARRELERLRKSA